MHIVDQEVGARIRARRMELAMSQETLAEAIGLTFQQIQKYEKGVNRVAASRLQEIAKVLSVPVSFFFEEGESFEGGSEIPGLISTPDAIPMLRAFSNCRPDTRRQLIAIAEAAKAS